MTCSPVGRVTQLEQGHSRALLSSCQGASGGSGPSRSWNVSTGQVLHTSIH